VRRAVRIAFALALSSTALTQATQQPTFRTGVDAVSVDVSVTSGTSPVAGLKAADFVLLDDGVRQTIDVVDTQTLPIDVSLVLDTSASEKPQSEDMRREIEKIEAVLGPDDRLEVMTIDTYVQQVFPMLAPSAHPPFSPTASGGLSSIYDAIAAAMLQPVLANRRHLVVALTDGYDTVSTLDAPAIRDLARRSDAALHIVSAITAPTVRALNTQSEAKGRPELIQVPAIPVDPRAPGPGELPQQCVETGLCEQWSRFWLPFADSSPDLLAEAARSTGGDVHDPGWFANRDLSSIFRQVFDDYRRSYVLRYTPANVARTGWHALTVRVAAAGAQSYLVRARSGYAIDSAAPPSPDHAPLWAAPDHPVSAALASVVDAYDSGDYQVAATALERVNDFGKLIHELEAAGNPWPSAPHREAVFVVELAATGLFRSDAPSRLAAFDLLRNYSRLVWNSGEADQFERLYYWAAITAVEGTIPGVAALPLIEAAEKRFPDEPRFQLAHAIVSDQEHSLPPYSDADQTLDLYAAAAKDPETSAEAHLRSAFLLHRVGRQDLALNALDVMTADEPDADLRYLRNLFRGRVQASRNQLNAAAFAYRAAIASAPDAQAARVGLMTTLFRLGDLHGAESAEGEIEAMTSGPIDPWWRFWQGDFRFYPAAIDALRKASR
jgi:VWFA-related protein